MGKKASITADLAFEALIAAEENMSAMQRIATGESTLEEELAALDAICGQAALAGCPEIEACSTCAHDAECSEIGGRQEGRGYGAACRPILGEPPYYERRPELDR